tara:strand:+ start:282 stop:512 length:231 start_codon:yes stop_codon:yes gene_type:complete
MTQTKCITVSDEFSQLSKENNLSWSEGAKIGMSVMLAELGIKEYDNKLNVYRKMMTFKDLAEKLSQRITDLENANK